MLWAAALLLVAGELWTASELRGLRETEDVRDAAAIEQAFERRLAELERFALDLAPSDLEAELVEALLALERLHPEAAMQWSRRVVENVPSTELTWAARSVLARGGDRRTLRLALRRYFDDPDAWRVVLGDGALATEDVRLRDYEPYGRPVALPGERLFRSQLEQSLGIKKPDNAMVGPSFLDVVRGIDAFPNDDALSVQSLVVGLPPAYRLRALRYLATSDHRALVGLPMAAAEIDRLYPYFAQSRHRPLRDRVRRSIAARAAALASLLLSPAAGDDEKRAHLAAMEDVWLDAIARGGPEVYRVLVTLVGEAAVERHIAAEPPTRALAVVPLAAARLRLEQWGSADAIRGLGEREDLLLSLPTLTALRRDSAGDVELAVESLLLSIGAAGSTAFLASEIGGERLEALLPAIMSAPAPVDLARVLMRVGAQETPSPDAFSAMSHFHARDPRAFLDWPGRPAGALVERAHLVMAFSGDVRSLPLLVDLVVLPPSEVSQEAAFRALAELDLGTFERRLHRLAGHPHRLVRFRTAAALTPTGQPWALRLLIAELDEEVPAERRRAEHALKRLEAKEALRLLAASVLDGTASPFAVKLYLELSGNVTSVAREQIWQILAPHVARFDRRALLAAARLDHPEASSAVRRFLGGAEPR